jgi:hypothetical protein
LTVEKTSSARCSLTVRDSAVEKYFRKHALLVMILRSYRSRHDVSRFQCPKRYCFRNREASSSHGRGSHSRAAFNHDCGDGRMRTCSNPPGGMALTHTTSPLPFAMRSSSFCRILYPGLRWRFSSRSHGGPPTAQDSGPQSGSWETGSRVSGTTGACRWPSPHL